MLLEACQSPPAASHSLLLVIFDRSWLDDDEPDDVDGLADGAVDDEPLDVEPEPLTPELLPEVVPELPLWEPELLGELLESLAPGMLPLEPLVVWAATIAGASATIAIRNRNSAFFIGCLLPLARVVLAGLGPAGAGE